MLRAGIVTSSFHGIGDIVTEQFEVRTVVSVAGGGNCFDPEETRRKAPKPDVL